MRQATRSRREETMLLRKVIVKASMFDQLILQHMVPEV